MKRKETKLEKNLQKIGFTLSYKTYEGKHQEKVSGYTFERKCNNITYIVNLDKTRTQIIAYSFRNSHYDYFDKGRIEGLMEVYESFGDELSTIYDFQKKETLDLVDFSDLEEDLDNPNVSYEVDSFND